MARQARGRVRSWRPGALSTGRGLLLDDEEAAPWFWLACRLREACLSKLPARRACPEANATATELLARRNLGGAAPKPRQTRRKFFSLARRSVVGRNAFKDLLGASALVLSASTERRRNPRIVRPLENPPLTIAISNSLVVAMRYRCSTAFRLLFDLSSRACPVSQRSRWQANRGRAMPTASEHTAASTASTKARHLDGRAGWRIPPRIAAPPHATRDTPWRKKHRLLRPPKRLCCMAKNHPKRRSTSPGPSRNDQ